MKEEPFESTTGEGGDQIALTKVRNVHFPAMKDWIKGFFEHKLSQVCYIHFQVINPLWHACMYIIIASS